MKNNGKQKRSILVSLGFLMVLGLSVALFIKSQERLEKSESEPNLQVSQISNQEIQVQQGLKKIETTQPQLPIMDESTKKVESKDPSIREPRYALKPEGNVIEFEVIDGHAIAYGDVLLGRLEDGFPQRRGKYEARNPQIWDHPEIPYYINPDVPRPERIEKALNVFRQQTPIRFIPYQNQKDAIVFEVGSEHCFSALGKIGGLQPIKLSAGCQSHEIMHEIMHALGFIHEQSRPDRDGHVEVLWDNIQEKYQSQFAIVPDSFFETERDSPFDYHSIMMYGPSDFSKIPNQITLRSKGSEPISPMKNGLSEGDIKRIRRLYHYE